jgi:hypothetical protein
MRPLAMVVTVRCGWVGPGAAEDVGVAKVAGLSTLGWRCGGGSVGRTARQALMAGHTAPLRTSFQTAAP